MRHIVPLLLVACSLLAAAPSEAAKKNRRRAARELEQGLQELNRGRYREALERLTEAHEHGARPVVLFHLGRAHQALGDCGAAIRLYERFLEGRPGGKERLAAEEAKSGCAARLAAAPAAAPPAEVPEKPEAARVEIAEPAPPTDPSPAPTEATAALILDRPASPESAASIGDAAGMPLATDPPEAWYRSTWLWTVVGGVIAAGAGAAAIVAPQNILSR